MQFENEINSRPARTWYQTEQQKKAGISDIIKNQNDLTAQLNSLGIQSKSLVFIKKR